ncbi:WYL domain-containing protein [Colwellia hornerae]|uniref:WYL domain-containing protein n=1 Tax=Colwellia hornerae TaxID=89402 RepID=A0A5C6QFT7_9GAMM|nr:WYL domain-containing protein [Colwellia hornerae]TWX52642.1 WYL domain-containing protein [Colwellia hornerae]TWX58405.1 WYL domain-containing protein [Colwellia hornerae]TWX67457.1 WYL domain-containing protein [Colwellia hornerae]
MSIISQKNKNTNEIEKLTFAQKQRLSFIDFTLLFKGSINRKELTEKFEMGLANATRDLTLYKELAPLNIDFNAQDRSYLQAKTFKPLFSYDSKQTLAKLSHKISDGFDGVMEVAFPVDAPLQLNVPDIFIVARIVQAILKGKAISIIYTSLSSGSKAREIVPHTIIDNGLRWHVRGYDRKTNSFRDFVITRISKVTLQDKHVDEFETAIEDNQWMRKMDLHIVPHPTNVKFPQAIELDYGMDGGMLQLTVRAALVGYLLRRWNVDCTEDSSLKGGEYQLWLSNRQTLYGAKNLAIAPGYQE